MKKYYHYSVKKAVTVKNLTTIESLEVSPQFSYPTEEHDFYELVYVDSGRLDCRMGEQELHLSQGTILLIAPAIPHSYRAVENIPASFFILCFHSASAPLTLLNKPITPGSEERRLFAKIVEEAKNAFSFPFNRKLHPLPSPSFGAMQLVVGKLEELLIELIRKELKENKFMRPIMNSVELENNLAEDIATLLKRHVYGKITLEEISAQTFYSKTYLNSIFKKSTGLTIIQYYHKLKAEEAKKLLRKKATSGEVAAKLSFDSATYFVKFFKKYTGMTPTEYRKKLL